MATICFFVEPVKDDSNKTEYWIRKDTGEKFFVNSHWDLPAGAMFYATWMEGIVEFCGPDGRSIMLITPGGGWMIDGRASNCDSPCRHCGVPYKDHPDKSSAEQAGCINFEDSRPHKCWIRHGEPPLLTVDKQGLTCGAGAGSIHIGQYHGFLQNGQLT